MNERPLSERDQKTVNEMIEFLRERIADDTASIERYKKLRRSLNCCGCAAFPVAMCGPCARLNDPESFEPGYEPWRRHDVR